MVSVGGLYEDVFEDRKSENLQPRMSEGLTLNFARQAKFNSRTP